jgi:hypothetical protein
MQKFVSDGDQAKAFHCRLLVEQHQNMARGCSRALFRRFSKHATAVDPHVVAASALLRLVLGIAAMDTRVFRWT